MRENPFVIVILRDPEKFQEWKIELRYNHSETEGPVFDEMDIKIKEITSMTGMAGIFKLRAADFYEVLSVRKCQNRSDN